MGCIEDPCRHFTHLDFMYTMRLLHNSNDIVAGVDLIEGAIIQLGDLLAEHAEIIEGLGHLDSLGPPLRLGSSWPSSG